MLLSYVSVHLEGHVKCLNLSLTEIQSSVGIRCVDAGIDFFLFNQPSVFISVK